jgi:Zn-dependent M28 family amino/carboxypeptidase
MKLTKILGVAIALIAYEISHAKDDTRIKSSLEIQTQQKDFISALIETAPSRGTHKQRAQAADFLLKKLKEAGLPAKRQTYQYPNIHDLLDLFVPPYRGQNIVSHIPATQPSEEYIVIGAHYDTVLDSPGADDNASGVAIIFSLGQALLELKERDVNFLIVFFDHEEDDGSGSKAYLRTLQKEGLSIISMHNIDMIGWDGDKDKTIELEFSTDKMENIYRSAATAHGVTITPVTYNSSDHIPFRQAGIEVVCMSEEYNSGDSTPHYHKATDTIETLDFEYLASTTLILTDVMTSLARQD